MLLSRGPCLGECPVYRFAISADRFAVWDGGSFVDREGTHVGALGEGVFEELAALAISLGFLGSTRSIRRLGPIFPTTRSWSAQALETRWSIRGGWASRTHSETLLSAWIAWQRESTGSRRSMIRSPRPGRTRGVAGRRPPVPATRTGPRSPAGRAGPAGPRVPHERGGSPCSTRPSARGGTRRSPPRGRGSPWPLHRRRRRRG